MIVLNKATKLSLHYSLEVLIVSIRSKDIKLLNKIKGDSIEGLYLEEAISRRKALLGEEEFNSLSVELAFMSHKDVEAHILINEDSINNFPIMEEGFFYQKAKFVFEKLL